MTRIILTRHGETEWNLHGFVQGSQDSPLTATGLSQAALLAERLQGEQIKAVFSSPLGRALATAKVIAEKFKLPLVQCPEFSEICFGTWEGKSWQDLRRDEPEGFNEWEKNPHLYRFPGGECMEDVLRRAKPKLQELCQAYPNDTICVVSHGITLKVLVTDLLGYSLSDWLQTPWQSNTAVNILEVYEDAVKNIVLGDCSHIR